MDAMPLLRSYRDDLPEPDEDRLAMVRLRLDDRIAAADDRGRRGRPVGRRLAIGALGAVAAAAVVVAVTAPAPGASAEAARLLDGAAAGARGAAATAGFRTVVIRSEGLSERLGQDGRVVAAYGARSEATLRIPVADGEWVRTTRSLPARTFYGGAAGRALAEDEDAVDPSGGPLVERSTDGDFTNGELGGGTVFGDSPAALRSLPTAPDRMLEALRRADLGAGAPSGPAGHVLAAAAAVLTGGTATPEVQSAVFQALQQQPGIVVVARVTDLDGRRGIAIGVERPSRRYDVQQLILDPTSGRYLGDRQVAAIDQGVLPAGTVVSATAVVED